MFEVGLPPGDEADQLRALTEPGQGDPLGTVRRRARAQDVQGSRYLSGPGVEHATPVEADRRIALQAVVVGMFEGRGGEALIGHGFNDLQISGIVPVA